MRRIPPRLWSSKANWMARRAATHSASKLLVPSWSFSHVTMRFHSSVIPFSDLFGHVSFHFQAFANVFPISVQPFVVLQAAQVWLSATVPSGHTVRVHKHLRRRRFAKLSSWSSFLELFKGRTQAPTYRTSGRLGDFKN